MRDDAYVSKAKKLLPRILHLGKLTGANTTRQLAFFTLSTDVEFRNDLGLAIQKAMMNDCPNVNEELLLSVVWGEPGILQQKLEESQASAAALGEGAVVDKERRDLLELAMARKDVPVARTLLAFMNEPTFLTLDHLFEERFNRYRPAAPPALVVCGRPLCA